MLRVETKELNGTLICRLEGRFTGEGAEQVRTLVTRCNSKLELVVDLTEIMFVDAIGEVVLSFVKKLGAQFVAETSYSRDICERLNLPLLREQKWNPHPSSNLDGYGNGPANNSRNRRTSTPNRQSSSVFGGLAEQEG
jgi:hypothetical protein